MLREMLENVRKKAPLVHNITNYVTVNDCANIIIACGGSPIMADDIAEVEEITAICGGLNINIGTLNETTIPSMFLAAKKANKLHHPIIFDPVGVGASAFRTHVAKELLDQIKFTVIRGNISEIKTLAIGTGTVNGVDADKSDIVTNENISSVIDFAKAFAKETGAVIVITGATDIVADDSIAYVIHNGCSMMARITGSGCMLTAMTAAYITANPDDILKATVASVCAMGVCGEKAYRTLVEQNSGNSSYRNFLIDEVFKLTSEELILGAKYEIK